MQPTEEVKNPLTSPFTPIGKKELCETIGWSRPRLDRRIASDKKFPVLHRGNQSGGWQFDLVAVIRHLAATPSPGSSNDSVGACPRLSSTEAREIDTELARIQAIRRVIEMLVAELGASLDRLSASLCQKGIAGTIADPEGPDGKMH